MSTSSGCMDPNPLGFDLSRGIHVGTVEDLNRFGDSFGPDMLNKLMDLNRMGVELAKSCVSAHYGYSRSCSSGSGGSAASSCLSLRSVGSGGSGSRVPVVGGSVGVSASVGLLRSKLDAIGRLKTWRRGVLPDGFCYSKAMRSPSESSLVDIGPHPTVASLCRLRAGRFLDFSAMSGFRLVPRGSGAYHLADSGDDGHPFLPALKAYVDGVEVLPGSFGDKLKSSSLSSLAVGVSASSRLGSGRVWKNYACPGPSIVVRLVPDGVEVSEDFLAGRLDEFKRHAEDGPECFDSISYAGDYGSYKLGSSRRNPAEGDVLDMAVALSGFAVLSKTSFGYVFDPLGFELGSGGPFGAPGRVHAPEFVKFGFVDEFRARAFHDRERKYVSSLLEHLEPVVVFEVDRWCVVYSGLSSDVAFRIADHARTSVNIYRSDVKVDVSCVR